MKSFLLMVLMLLAFPGIVFAAGEQATMNYDISKKVPITFYLKGGPAPEQEKVFSVIEEKIAGTINVELDFNWIPWGDYNQKLQVLFASGDPFEIGLDNSWGAYYSNVGKGNYMDLSELLPEYMPNYWSTMQEALELTKYKGGIYGIPNKRSEGPASRGTVYVRGDLWEKYYNQEIQNYDDLEEFLMIIKMKEPDIVPLSPVRYSGLFTETVGTHGDSDSFVIVHPGLLIGYMLNDPDMKLIYAGDTETYRALSEKANQWYMKGLLPVDMLSGTWDNMEINSGKVAAHFHGGYFSSDKEADKKNLGFWTKGFPLNMDKPVVRRDILGSTKVMNAMADQAERTLMFLDWVHGSQENYDLFSYGIEGEHWVPFGNHQWKYGDNYNSENNPYPWWACSWYFEDEDYTRFTEAQNPEVVQLEKLLNETGAVTAPHAGLFLDYAPIKTEVANVGNVLTESMLPIAKGVVSVTEYDNALKKVHDAGMDVILVELQKQLDAWRSETGR